MILPIVDSWIIVDNGVELREVIAEGDTNECNVYINDKFLVVSDIRKSCSICVR